MSTDDDLKAKAGNLLKKFAPQIGMFGSLYLDPDAHLIDRQDVEDGSGGGKLNDVEFYTPEPGHGFFVQIRMSGIQSTMPVFEINGVGWRVKAVQLVGNKYEVTDVSNISAGKDFLDKF